MTDTRTEIRDALLAVISEYVYEAYRLGKYGKTEYLPMWHETERRPMPEAQHAADALLDGPLAALLRDDRETRQGVEAWAETWLADWREQPERQRIIELKAALNGAPVDPLAAHRVAIATSCRGCGVTAAHCESLWQTEPEYWPCCNDCSHYAQPRAAAVPPPAEEGVKSWGCSECGHPGGEGSCECDCHD